MSAITVSEETLKRILAEFKLELMQDLRSYATTDSLSPLYAKADDNTRRIGDLERAISAATAVSAFSRVLWPAFVFGAIGALGILVTVILHGG